MTPNQENIILLLYIFWWLEAVALIIVGVAGVEKSKRYGLSDVLWGIMIVGILLLFLTE